MATPSTTGTAAWATTPPPRSTTAPHTPSNNDAKTAWTATTNNTPNGSPNHPKHPHYPSPPESTTSCLRQLDNFRRAVAGNLARCSADGLSADHAGSTGRGALEEGVLKGAARFSAALEV